MTLNEPPATVPARIDRRTLVKAGAWALPVIAIAAATPNAMASTVDVGAFHLDGTCGILGILGPGFTLTASPTAPLPVGTSIAITGSGIANIGVFSVTGGVASVSVVSATSRLITLAAAVPAGATIAFRTTLSISVAFALSGSVTLPADYIGTGAKTAGAVNSTLVLCSAS